MNERNVEALKALIDRAKDAESDDYLPCETDWLARCLASMGVLVPSALTDGQLDDDKFRILATIPGKVLHADKIREYLERIAKGDGA